MGRVDTGSIDKIVARAESGEAEAQFNLGLIYAMGRVVDPDFVSAHKWFNLAALAGLEAAREEREALSSVMTPTEIAEAQRRAREWKHSH